MNAHLRTSLGVFSLVIASVCLFGITWLLVEMIDSGIDARMLARFESEPPEGLDYWWWHYFKESFAGNFPVYASIAFCWICLGWGWIKVSTRFFKMLSPRNA